MERTLKRQRLKDFTLLEYSTEPSLKKINGTQSNWKEVRTNLVFRFPSSAKVEDAPRNKYEVVASEKSVLETKEDEVDAAAVESVLKSTDDEVVIAADKLVLDRKNDEVVASAEKSLLKSKDDEVVVTAEDHEIVAAEELVLKSKDEVASKDSEQTVQKTWNLRPRGTSIVKRLINETDGVASNHKLNISTTVPSTVPAKSNVFSISLTKEEIEEDFLAVTGSKPPSRPKKRPRHIPKKLNNFFPGLCLDGMSAEKYKV